MPVNAVINAPITGPQQVSVTLPSSSATTDIAAGNGLSKVGNILNVNVDGSTIQIINDTLVAAGIDNEAAQDAAASLFTSGSHSGISFSYDDQNNRINATATGLASTSFTNIAVTGQNNIVADSATDTLNLSPAGLISLTTNATTDTLTLSTVSSSSIPFVKSDGTVTSIELQTSGSLSDIITNLHIPFTTSNGSNVTTLRVN